MNKKLARRGCVFTLDPRRDPRRDISAMLTSLARVKLAQCKQNLARPWFGHGQGASVNRVYSNWTRQRQFDVLINRSIHNGRAAL